jgi:KDO2-lipid IV(A) lauroyltransferase
LQPPRPTLFIVLDSTIRLLVSALARLIAGLPLPVVHGLGAALGHLVYALSAQYRHKLQTMLQIAGLDSPALRRAAAAQAGRAALEMPWVWMRPSAQVLAKIAPIDWSAFDAVDRAGKGVLLLTPHLGCFEVAARCRAAMAPITVLYKPPRRAAMRILVESARNVPGLMAAPANLAGVRMLIRALRRGEVVGMLPDQVPDAGEGLWAPFFGRPAYTMTLPGRLAQASGAAVVLLIAQRLPRGRGWKIHVEPFSAAPDPHALNAAMEQLVRRFPDQYLWGYNRFKRPAGVAPAANTTPSSP